MPAGTVLLVAPFGGPSHAALQQRALERLDWSVVPVDVSARPGWKDRLRGRARVADRLAAALGAQPVDLVLVSEGADLPETVVSRLRRLSPARWALWVSGDPLPQVWGPHRLSGFDRVFATASDVAERLPAAFLPHACDPSVHRRVPVELGWRAPVAFTGAASPHREALLSALRDLGLALWGPGWGQTSLRDHVRGELASPDDYLRAASGASVLVNIHPASPSGRGGRGCNRRLFEVAAVGTPQVVDARDDLPRLFTPSEEILVFRTADELAALVREALGDTAAAEQRAARARRRALAEHTYMHRMERVVGEEGRRW